jgi:Flp pilus assembly pilin Flp
MAMVLAAVKTFARGEEGAAIVEYALGLALITLVCLASIAALGAKLSTFFNAASTTI